MKLSEFWSRVVLAPPPRGVTVVQIDTQYLPEMQGRILSLEQENDWLWKRLEELGYDGENTEAEVEKYVNTLKGFEDKLIDAEMIIESIKEVVDNWRNAWWLDPIPRTIVGYCREEIEKVLG